MRPKPQLRPETLAVHAAALPDRETGALAPPIHLSTTFERDPDGGYARGFIYVRESNPNRQALEAALTALEGGAEALVFASGMAAANAVFQTLAPGDRVICAADAYYGVPKLLREVWVPWGLDVIFADLTDAQELRGHLASTPEAANPEGTDTASRGRRTLIWVETPSNPLLRVTDLDLVVGLARPSGALVVVDNTWATPLLQRPLDHGADVVLHATTKYLGGHSDVQGGALVVRQADAFAARLRTIQREAGAVGAPFDSWLVLRGLRTLAVRMRAHSESGQAVAEFLAAHPRVELVAYPGLPTHPGHAAAARQMTRFGGMLSFVVPGGRPAALALAARLQLFRRATSLGGPESLVEHRASIEGPQTRAPEGLLRLSIGLEHPDDLIADLAAALADE